MIIWLGTFDVMTFKTTTYVLGLIVGENDKFKLVTSKLLGLFEYFNLTICKRYLLWDHQLSIDHLILLRAC